jgi:hypothetical protein
MHPLIVSTVATHIVTDRHETAARARRRRAGQLAARGRRPVAMDRPAPPMPAPVVIRPATAVDSADVARLAELDSAEPLHGEVVLAYAGGDIRAALSVDSGRAIADPFWPSAELVDLLREVVQSENRRERRFARHRRRELAVV